MEGVGNDCKVVLQLNHLGRQSDHPVAPSSVYDSFLGQNARELTVEEIREIIECFSQAIRRAREPDLPNRWLRGIGGETAECKSCNACIDLEKSLGCKAEKKQTE